MDDKISRNHSTGALNLVALAKLEQDLRTMSIFNATVSRERFSFNFQVRALKRYRARDDGTPVCIMLTATMGEDLALQCNRWKKGCSQPSLCRGHYWYVDSITFIYCLTVMKSIMALQEEPVLGFERIIKHWFTGAQDRRYGRRVRSYALTSTDLHVTVHGI